MQQAQLENNLIQRPVTRRDIANTTGLKGKALTDHIRSIQSGGGVVAFLRFVDPTKDNKRERVYSSVAIQQSLIGAE